MSYDKCQLLPAQTLTLLGFLFNTRDMKIYVPSTKAERIVQLIAATQSTDAIPTKQVQSLAGMLLALKPAVHLASLYCRAAYAALSTAELDRNCPAIPFTTLLRQDLARWARLLTPPIAGRPMIVSSLQTLKVWSDASKIGGGSFAKWSKMLSKERVKHLVAAGAAAGYRQTERRTDYSLQLKDRAAMKNSKLSFIEHE